MNPSEDAKSQDEYDSKLDEPFSEPFNAEIEEINEDVDILIKSDAIGNTLYSKSWLLKFFLNLANSRRVEELDRNFEKGKQKDNQGKDEADTSNPESILSNFDSLVAMSAEESVAEYLIDPSNGCLGMLVAEILPVQVNEEHQDFVEIRSHFWRRQELCLVTLSNIVVHEDVLRRMIADISNAKPDKVYDEQNILSQLLRLSFSCVLFGENFGLQAQFTSVLVACFQFLRNLTYSLNTLICESQDNSSTTSNEVEDNINIQPAKNECADSNTPTILPDCNSPEKLDTIPCHDREKMESAVDKLTAQSKTNDLTVTLRCLADEILSIVSKSEVVQMFGMVLASSCNEELLNKMSRLLTVLIELASDLESENLIVAYGQLPFLYGLKEAIKQTYSGTPDMKTTLIYIDVAGEVLNQLNNTFETPKAKALFVDENGQKDEQFPMELCDLLADITNDIDDLNSCATIAKVLRVLWQSSVSSKHSKSFENVGKWLMNTKRQMPDSSSLGLEDQVAFTSIIDALSQFIQTYDLGGPEGNEVIQSLECSLIRFVQKENDCHQQFLKNKQSADT